MAGATRSFPRRKKNSHWDSAVSRLECLRSFTSQIVSSSAKIIPEHNFVTLKKLDCLSRSRELCRYKNSFKFITNPKNVSVNKNHEAKNWTEVKYFPFNFKLVKDKKRDSTEKSSNFFHRDGSLSTGQKKAEKRFPNVELSVPSRRGLRFFGN